MDPDSATFVIDLQDVNKKLIIKKVNMLTTVLFEGTFTWFFKDKKSLTFAGGG
jgi:hypothetical protein